MAEGQRSRKSTPASRLSWFCRAFRQLPELLSLPKTHRAESAAASRREYAGLTRAPVPHSREKARCLRPPDQAWDRGSTPQTAARRECPAFLERWTSADKPLHPSL